MLTQENQIAKTLKPLPDSKDMGFGVHFSDHWFLAKFADGQGWFDGHIEPYGKLAIDPAASVLHYGQALFEGMKAFRQKKDGSISIFRPDFNWKRLREGSGRLCLEAPPRDLFMKGLKDLLVLDSRWVPTEENCSLYIRPTLIGTEAFLGVRPSREVLFYILLSPVGSYYGSNKPLKIWVESAALRAAPGGLGATKAGANYAASLQAALLAKKKGYAQVLWLDAAREGIEEVGTMNVFFVFKDEVVTPALNGSILSGGVRDSALQLLRHRGVKAVERRLTIAELLERSKKGELVEAFGTGTAAVISPIGELAYNDEIIRIPGDDIGPVGRRLFDELTGIQRGTLPDPFGWMVKLDDLA